MTEQFEFDFDSPAVQDSNLDSVFEEALRTVVKKEPRPPVEARFYPYAGLSSTIRLRKGRVYARVWDVLRHSPREVLYALACILVAKLYRLKASKEHERTYREHALDPSVLDRSESMRRRRGYKMTTSRDGKMYDLDGMFSDLNAHYFRGELARPVLSWSVRQTPRVLA